MLLARNSVRNGSIAKGKDIQEGIVERLTALYGEEDMSTLDACGDLAETMSTLGEHAEALGLLRRVQDGREKLFGADHSRSIDAAEGVANEYESVERLSEAKQLREIVLAARTRILGPDHSDTTRAKLALVGTYVMEENIVEARKILGDVEETLKKEPDKESWNRVEAMECTARVYSKENKWSEAVGLWETVVNIRKKKGNGKLHFSDLGATGELAIAYRQTKNFPEALKLQEMAVNECNKVFGPSHRETIKALSQCSLTFLESKEFAKALSVCQQTLRLLDEHFSDDTVQKIVLLEDLVDIHEAMGHVSEVVQAMDRLLEAMIKVHGETDPMTIVFAGRVTEYIKQHGDSEEAHRVKAKLRGIGNRVWIIRVFASTLESSEIETSDGQTQTGTSGSKSHRKGLGGWIGRKLKRLSKR